MSRIAPSETIRQELADLHVIEFGASDMISVDRRMSTPAATNSAPNLSFKARRPQLARRRAYHGICHTCSGARG